MARNTKAAQIKLIADPEETTIPRGVEPGDTYRWKLLIR